GDADVALPGDRGGVDVGGLLVQHRLEQALDHGRGDRVGVDGELAGQLDLELAHAPPAELADDAPEDLPELQVVAEGGHDLRRQRRRVDHATRVVAPQRHDRALEDLGADAPLRLDGVRAEVGGEHDVVAVQERVVWGRRLERVDVEPGGEDLAALQRLDERVLPDDPAPRGVDDDG